MERKNKLVLFLLIVLVMTVALISSFGLNIFAGKGAEIVLPTPAATSSGEDEGLEGGGQVLPVRTTPETVQNIIATLTGRRTMPARSRWRWPPERVRRGALPRTFW